MMVATLSIQLYCKIAQIFDKKRHIPEKVVEIANIICYNIKGYTFYRDEPNTNFSKR